jgi:UDP-glucose 4-epimerase
VNVLVTGGAGYIGSHAVRALRAAGHGVVVLDNLCRGHRRAVPDDVRLHALDLREAEAIAALLREHGIQCVMHFAALTYVGESVQQPLWYYANNTAGALSVLRACRDAGVMRFVFSSTAATYGEPEQMPIVETTPQRPINPYGRSKLMVEQMLADHAAAEPGFAYAALRYFNVAGAALDDKGEAVLGEDHEPETHLVPLVLLTALGRRDAITVFGEDYPTPDGTCVRDYVHVQDLVDAHVLVMDKLADGDQRHYNLGIGRGHSVRQIIDAAHEVTGREIPVTMGPRRAGDAPQLYADPAKIASELGWRARHTDIRQIIDSAWRWHVSHPDGYGDGSLE